jgi:AraC-like DNA-binding protein
VKVTVACPFDDVPEWLCISEECKPIHILKPIARKEGFMIDYRKGANRRSLSCVRQDLKDERRRLGKGICKLARQNRIGKTTLIMLNSVDKDKPVFVKELRTVLLIYTIYGELIKNLAYGDSSYFTRAKKVDYKYWYEFVDIREQAGYKEAAFMILQKMEAEK